MKKNLSIAILAAAIVLALWLQPWSSPDPPEPESWRSGPAVATVGNTTVMLSQAQSRYETMSSIHGSGVLDEEALQERILDSLKFDVVVVDSAAGRGVVVTPAELAIYMSGSLGSQSTGSQATSLNEIANELGVSLPELARRVYLNFLGARLYEDVGAEGMSLSDQEIRKYYRQHRDEFSISPDEDPVVAFESIKPELAQQLIKEKQDAAFNEWFIEKAADYDIEIIMEDWWNQIEKKSPQQEPNGTGGSEGNQVSPGP